MRYLLLFMSFFSPLVFSQSSEKSVHSLIQSSYLETENEKISSFKHNDFEISFEKNSFIKNEEGLNNESLSVFYVIDGNQSLLFRQEEFNPYGQSALVLTCKSDDKTVLFVQTRFSSSSNIYPWYIQFTPYIYKYMNGKFERDEIKENKYFYGDDYFNRLIIDDEPPKVNYPYYDEKRVYKRLFETQVCNDFDD
ncbi:hypothetical protein ACE34P_001674 [Vibrio fluvialis]|uniref:hypothetical protein n=1 Tax=Vibrio fluvialis TaxID=676 RepID=UPI00155925C1|nr:hypothetical protein [Vibrio fluvialis]EKO3465489.1 hypothetical protein [Vibrio fluvialis]EKO3475844.1 hypothetical protein [Vibrio fluvialis]EKO3504326.1 hypothetical protein [Vibrio fluvialis]EKO3954508.1 hypothetical protein [Vibrio fluvialis]EKO5149378.1 hypothetical protein [Vibrio fluvialis]